MQQLTLVTGPARSGKSEWAEKLATLSGKRVVYVATAQTNPADLEWQARIELHRQRRPQDWQTVEVPVELAAMIRVTSEAHCLLIDSLGTWVANCLEQDDKVWDETVRTVLMSFKNAVCDVILVAEETGWGVVPSYLSGRTFRDRLGTLTRQIGAIANPVYLVMAGHVLNLSVLGEPL